MGVVRVLAAAGARVNAKDIMGNTPLGLAAGPFATADSLAVARALAKHGADMRTRTRFGHPLLFQPCTCQSPGPNVEAISLLLELGADPTESMGSFTRDGASGSNTLYLFLQSVGQRTALAMVEPLTTLPIGTVVEIRELTSRPDLNGARGAIRGWFTNEDRYTVELASSQDATATGEAAGAATRIKVRPANLQRVAEEGKAAAESRGETEASVKDTCGGPLHLDKGRVVQMHGLQSRADLNGRHGVVDKWDAPAGRYALHVRPQHGHSGNVVRIKPDHVSEQICRDAIDPDKLPKWRGHGAVHCQHGPLATCFEAAMPVGALMALDSGRTEATLTPACQFLYSMFYIARAWEDPAKHAWRQVLEDPERSTSVTIDIMRPPLECPEHIEANPTRFRDGARKGERDASGTAAAAEPLLLVRYLAATRDTSRSKGALPVARLDLAMPDYCPVSMACSLAATETPGRAQIHAVKAASAAEVAAAVAMLQANEQQLDEAYATRFYQHSEHHRKQPGYFRCSFLVPPTERMLQEPGKQHSDGTSSGKTAAEGEMPKRSAQSNGAENGTKEQQASDRNTHETESGKSAERLPVHEDPTSGAARASLVFDLAYVPPYMMGKTVAGRDTTGQPTPPRLLDGKAPENIHGNDEFAVRVQGSDAALQGSEGAIPCKVYDEARSFDGFLECQTPGIQPLLRLIKERGEFASGRGGKGYFRARREGTNLRRFTDDILPLTAW